jgi:hypothetical protein
VADDARFVEIQDEQKEPQDGEPAAEESFAYPEDSANLVVEFSKDPEGQEALRAIGELVHKRYTADYESSEEYRARFARDWRMLVGDMPPKTHPFADCANGHVPLMLENIIRVQNFGIDAIFGDWSSIVQFTKIGLDDERSDVCEMHTNYQFAEEIPDFDRQMERAHLLYWVAGDVTNHSFYDARLRQNRHETLTCDEFVIPFVYVTTMPDYSDCPHMTRILRYYRHQLQGMEGDWEGVQDVIDGVATDWNDEPYPTLRMDVARTQRIVEPDSDEPRPFVILHYEGWDEGLLPNQDRDRFIQVIVDEKTKNVLKLTIHEKVDWQEKTRIEIQQGEKDAFGQAMKQHQDMLGLHADAMVQHGTMQGQFQAAQDHMQKHGALPNQMPMPPDPGPAPQAPPEPPMPGWMKSPDDEPPEARKSPIHLFSHCVFTENLVGSLGIGAGRIQADFNRAANTLLNQYVDAATLNNCKSFISSDQLTWDDRDPYRVGPGRVTKVSGVTNLKEALVEIAPGQANPQLMEIIKEIWTWGQSSMNAQDVLSGAEGKSGETWRGLQSRMEQAGKMLAVPERKFTKHVKQIARNNCDLNALFLPEYELKVMFDYKSKLQRQVTLTRDLYQRDLHFQIRADLSASTKAQRIAEADEIVQVPNAVPALSQNPAFTYQALVRALKARNLDDMIPSLGAAPPAPQMFGMMPVPPPGLMPIPPPQKPGAPQGNQPPPQGAPPQGQ